MPTNYYRVSNLLKLFFNVTNKKNSKNILAAKCIPTHWMNGSLMAAYAEDVLLKHFQTHSLKGFGVDDLNNGLIAAGAILHYLKDTEHPNLQHITSLQRIDRDDFLWMDRFTIRNLELVYGNVGRQSHFIECFGQYRFTDGCKVAETMDRFSSERYSENQ